MAGGSNYVSPSTTASPSPKSATQELASHPKTFRTSSTVFIAPIAPALEKLAAQASVLRSAAGLLARTAAKFAFKASPLKAPHSRFGFPSRANDPATAERNSPAHNFCFATKFSCDFQFQRLLCKIRSEGGMNRESAAQNFRSRPFGIRDCRH